ncbi:hypothetical protein FB107DRAFT_279531 [Schizophyllum commune]
MAGKRSTSRRKAPPTQTTAQQDVQGPTVTATAQTATARSRANKKPAGDSRAARKTKSSSSKTNNVFACEDKEGPRRANKRRKVASPEPAAVDNDADVENLTRDTQGFTDLPHEILLEIFMVCDPGDILRLAQTSKALRGILMHKSSKWIWEHTIKHYRTPIPPCPNNRLSIPRYISLLFSTNCFDCGSDKGKHALWCFLDRMCNKCINKKYMVIDHGSYYGVRTWYQMPGGYAGPEQLIANRQEAKKIRDETKRIEDTGAYYSRLRAIDKVSQESMAFEKVMEEFLKAEKKEDVKERRRICQRRYDFIASKLTEMGYGDEIPKLQSWRPHYLNEYTEGDQDMTNEAWASMKSNVQEYIDALIPYRKKDAALDAFSARAERLQLKDYSTLAPGSLRPHWAALAMKEPIRTLLMQDLETGSTDVLSSISDKRLVELAQECAAEATAFLRALIPRKVPVKKEKGKSADETPDEVTDESLFLATTYFWCTNDKCLEPMSYPRAAIHECLYAAESPPDQGDTTISLTTMLAAKGCADKPFYHPSAAKKKKKRVTFDLEASQHAKILIKACGLNPKTATFADMESLNLLHSLKKHRVEDGEHLELHWEVVKDEWRLKRIEADEIRNPAWSRQQCPVDDCKTDIVCPNGQSDAFDWHNAVAHKDLSCATDISMVKDYPEPVNY